jgi:hypothetical protein
MILREYDLSEQDWPECRSEHFLPFKTAIFILSFIFQNRLYFVRFFSILIYIDTYRLEFAYILKQRRGVYAQAI